MNKYALNFLVFNASTLPLPKCFVKQFLSDLAQTSSAYPQKSKINKQIRNQLRSAKNATIRNRDIM